MRTAKFFFLGWEQSSSSSCFISSCRHVHGHAACVWHKQHCPGRFIPERLSNFFWTATYLVLGYGGAAAWQQSSYSTPSWVIIIAAAIGLALTTHLTIRRAFRRNGDRSIKWRSVRLGVWPLRMWHRRIVLSAGVASRATSCSRLRSRWPETHLHASRADRHGWWDRLQRQCITRVFQQLQGPLCAPS